MSTAVRIGRFAPGSPEWRLARVSALGGSEVAAVLGLSPWESRFSLWRRRKGLAAPVADNELMHWGRRLEEPIARVFAESHPDFRVRRTGTWRSEHRPWQIATPDRLLSTPDGRAALEIKTARDAWEWGKPGTDEVPVYYRAQVLWCLDVLGLSRAYLAVLIAGSDYREYVIDYALDEVAILRTAAREFLDSLDGGVRPSLDEHTATYRVVRELHPDIDDREVEIPQTLAERYQATVAEHKAAEHAKQRVTAEVLDVLGTARRAVVAGESIAIRVPGRAGAPPSLRPSQIRTPPRKVSAAA